MSIGFGPIAVIRSSDFQSRAQKMIVPFGWTFATTVMVDHLRVECQIRSDTRETLSDGRRLIVLKTDCGKKIHLKDQQLLNCGLFLPTAFLKLSEVPREILYTRPLVRKAVN